MASTTMTTPSQRSAISTSARFYPDGSISTVPWMSDAPSRQGLFTNPSRVLVTSTSVPQEDPPALNSHISRIEPVNALETGFIVGSNGLESTSSVRPAQLDSNGFIQTGTQRLGNGYVVIETTGIPQAACYGAKCLLSSTYTGPSVVTSSSPSIRSKDRLSTQYRGSTTTSFVTSSVQLLSTMSTTRPLVNPTLAGDDKKFDTSVPLSLTRWA